MIFPDLSYADAMGIAGIERLSERRKYGGMQGPSVYCLRDAVLIHACSTTKHACDCHDLKNIGLAA